MWRYLRLLLLISLSAAPLLAQSSSVAVIGGEESTGAELGNFVKVLALQDHIIVLERDAPFIRVFDANGQPRQSLGRLGSGPGEYRAPTWLSWDSHARRVLVVDASNARVTSYALGDTLASPLFLTLENIGIRRVCRVGESLYGFDRIAPQLVRELIIREDRLVSVRTFGDRVTRHPLGKHRLVLSRVNDGPLHCDERTGTVFVGSRMLGEIQEIELRSGRQTTTTLEGFKGPALSIVDEGTALRQQVPESGMDMLDNILGGPEGLLVIIGKWRLQQGSSVPVAYEIARLRNGLAMDRRTGSSMPVGYTRRGVVCARMDPVPTILLPSGRSCD